MTSIELVPQPFLDWYGVWAGQTGIDENNQAWGQDPPMGVSLRVQQAEKSEVFIRAEHPWEEGSVSPSCVVEDGGLLKLWYHSCGADEGDLTYMAYAESTDGFEWQRPELGLQEYGGSRKNNLLFSMKEFELQSVFVDPSAPAEERFKALARDATVYHKGRIIPKVLREEKWEIRRQMDEAGLTREQKSEEFYFHGLLRGAVSPDGCRWKFLDEPLLNVGRSGLDSQNIASFDPDTETYLGYLRGHMDRRRCIRRTEGTEFGNWSATRPVFFMDPQDPPDDDVYNSAYCRCPGSGRHLIFPGIYHRSASTTDVQLATSRDGQLWSRPERRPVITREAEGDSYGMVFAFPDLVHLADDEWGLMMHGSFDLHDWGNRYDARKKPEWRWARWKRDRLVALEARAEGRVTLVERECQGQELRINFQTEKEGGWIKVELVEPPSTPAAPVKAIEGFGLDAADVLSGDEVSAVATWKGKSDLSTLRGRHLSIRIHMARARLFSTAM